jgi:hypothetical protein
LPDIGPKAPILIGFLDCAQDVELTEMSAVAHIPPATNVLRSKLLIVMALLHEKLLLS